MLLLPIMLAVINPPTIPLPGIDPEETYIWKQPKCPSRTEWINKLWPLHGMEYNTAGPWTSYRDTYHYGWIDFIYLQFKTREPQTTMFRGPGLGGKTVMKVRQQFPSHQDSGPAGGEGGSWLGQGTQEWMGAAVIFFPHSSYKCLYYTC